jgi:glucose-6-phosphate isomerase
MDPKAARLTERPAWKALADHYRQIRDVHLRTLFAEDPRRFAVEAEGLYLDYSKHRVTAETMRLLLALAEESVRPGRDLGHRLLRSMGRRAGQGAGAAHHPGT